MVAGDARPVRGLKNKAGTRDCGGLLEGRIGPLNATRTASDVPDCGAFPEELSGYQVYAGDGHWHAAAPHEAPIDGQLWAAGHLYALSLRTRALPHLEMAEGKKEHDMHVLKRLGAQALRMGARKGRKSLWIWDRAGPDYEP